MPSPNAPARRRFVVGIGVGNYKDPEMNLQFAHQDAQRMTAWFAQDTRVKYQPALPDLAVDPTNEQIRTGLADWLNTLVPEDVVVIYVAAHGQIENGVAYLQGHDSPLQKLAGKAVEAGTLGNIIGQSPPNNVLVIVDTCGAGRLGSSISQSADQGAYEANTREAYTTWAQAIVCSAFSRDPAYDGKFVEAFIRMVSQERWTGADQEWIEIPQFVGALNSVLREMKVPQVAEHKMWGNGPTQVIPNPYYGTRQLGALIGDIELKSHFDPASRGVSRGEQGSYFTGRSSELHRIVRWLEQPADGSDRDLFVITGSPGSGKSALLSRVIVLSDPTLRAGVSDIATLPADTKPPESSIDVVLWCRGKTLEQLVLELSQRLKLTARTPDALKAALAGGLPTSDTDGRAAMRAITIAIDALDEASEGESSRIATELIRPLVTSRGVKVIVATRPRPVRGAIAAADPTTSLLSTLGVSPDDQNCLVLDRSDNHLEMQQYVVARLMATEEPERRTPYRDRKDLATALAPRIASAAGKSFLVAAITARSLANRSEAVDPKVESVTFPTEAGEALAAYIAQLPNPRVVEDILRPLAWAEGAGGLPWGPIWAPLANALARLARKEDRIPHYTDETVAAVLDSAGDLIVESMPGTEPVYRLFHEALAEHLRRSVHTEAANAAIATALDTLTENVPWENVHPYVLAHFGTYLSRTPGGFDRLYELATNPDFERAHRLRFGHSMGFLKVVDLAIARAVAKSPVDWTSLTAACLVYSRQMAVAPALVLSAVAKAGQLQRAELMANNITFAIERSWAYSLLAPIFKQEADLEGAQRCFDEAERAVASIDLTHSSMAWSWLTFAADACELPALAKRYASRARQAAVDRADLIGKPGGPDEWDLPNALFWAGKAARDAHDDDAIATLREIFNKVFGCNVRIPFRNQELQAASVLGADDTLKTIHRSAVDQRTGSSPVRDGNLALALAKARLMTELHELFDVVDREGGPWGEEDARKRYAWALAIDGRFDRALDVVASIDDVEERARALRRVAGEFVEKKTDALLARVGTIAKTLESSSDPKVRSLLASVFDRLGDKGRALVFAEDVIRRGITTNANNTLAFRKPDGARRPLSTDIADLADEQSMKESVLLSKARKVEEAKAKLSFIHVPRFRWEALFWIAFKLPTAESAEYWRAALLEARRVGSELVHLSAHYVATLTATDDERKRFTNEIVTVQKRWLEASFVEQYDSLRASLDAGSQRTGRLEDLVSSTLQNNWLLLLFGKSKLTSAQNATWSVTQDLAKEAPIEWLKTAFKAKGLSWTPEHVSDLVGSGRPGKRVFAITLMRGNPKLRDFDLLVELIQGSLSAFEQYHALNVMKDLAPSLSLKQRKALRATLKKERTRYITPETDRERLSQEIERRLDEADAEKK